jgi:hypothetical protein
MQNRSLENAIIWHHLASPSEKLPGVKTRSALLSAYMCLDTFTLIIESNRGVGYGLSTPGGRPRRLGQSVGVVTVPGGSLGSLESNWSSR